MGMLLAGQHHLGLSHIRLVPQCYSASMQLCLIQTDVYSQFVTAVFHIWSLFAGQGHFFVAGFSVLLEDLFHIMSLVSKPL